QVPVTSPTYTLSLHDALPIYLAEALAQRLERPAYEKACRALLRRLDRKRLRGVVAWAEELLRQPESGGESEEAGGEKSSEEGRRSEEHTSELQSRSDLVCRLL